MLELMVFILHGNCFSFDQGNKAFAMQNDDQVKIRLK